MQLSLFQPKHHAQPSGDIRRADEIRSVLGPFLPVMAVDDVVAQLLEHPVSVVVTGQRTSKSGDFRPPFRSQPARITINRNLNSYNFLITLIHEMAHHRVHLDYVRAKSGLFFMRKKAPQPHGDEWKQKFRLLMLPYLSAEIFPADLLTPLVRYMQNPRASTTADTQLTKVLRTYDAGGPALRLEELPYDAVFAIHGRRFFRKKEKVRSRYRCVCLRTERIYLVSGVAPVTTLDNG